ncbi:MAG: helix-hairpin-helix domain-containing protein [Lachnospiraceae bacterium]|nr:helix-hairpin-helix domain-containing protein [Lachnospiraceae bacterium]
MIIINTRMKPVKPVIPAMVISALLVLASCGDSGNMTLSQLESASGAPTASGTGRGSSSDFVPDTGQDTSPQTPDVSVIVVYICGSVQNPGVYELPAGSRVCDGLEAAGGFTEGADEKRINLAGILSDGDMVFFPEEGEELTPGASDYIAASDGGAAHQLVNINTAGEDALCTLPGIGSSKAQAIIRYREEHGSFKDTKDIMNVNGIGENLFRQIEGLICV